MNRFKWLAVACLAVPAAAGTPGRSDSLEAGPHWGAEASFGRPWVPSSLAKAAQDRYTANANGIAYNFGLVRFHANGAPSFTLRFTRSTFDGSATELGGDTAQYKGNATVSGFMATKHVSFLARRRWSFGMSFGGGVGPQFQAHYTRTVVANGSVSTTQRVYTLQDIPVTPLFEVLFRADVRLSRTLSVGPWAGMNTGIPVVGGALRVHFLKGNS